MTRALILDSKAFSPAPDKLACGVYACQDLTAYSRKSSVLMWVPGDHRSSTCAVKICLASFWLQHGVREPHNLRLNVFSAHPPVKALSVCR